MVPPRYRSPTDTEANFYSERSTIGKSAKAVAKSEANVVPTPKGDRETFAHLTSTLVHGLEVARRRPVVRNFFLISIIGGLSSEAFDRLWTVRILDDFRLPTHRYL
jgi:hypothetical protein